MDQFNKEIYTKVIKSIEEITVDLLAELDPTSNTKAHFVYAKYIKDLRKILNSYLDYKEKEVEELRNGFSLQLL